MATGSLRSRCSWPRLRFEVPVLAVRPGRADGAHHHTAPPARWPGRFSTAAGQPKPLEASAERARAGYVRVGHRDLRPLILLGVPLQAVVMHPRPALALLAATTATAFRYGREWQLTWGATPQEVSRPAW